MDYNKTIMKDYKSTNNTILEEIGNHLRESRLRQNLSQSSLAAATRLSLNVIKSLEKGQGKLSTLVAVLRELHELDSLEPLVKKQDISPIQLLKLKGKSRKRASKSSEKAKP